MHADDTTRRTDLRAVLRRRTTPTTLVTSSRLGEFFDDDLVVAPANLADR
jgi:hypothetical protein